MRRSAVLIGFFIAFLGAVASARHIVGGEIRMEYSSTPNRFTFTLIQFWDQNTLTDGNRNADAELLFYRKRDNALIRRLTLPYITSRTISYQNKACAAFRSLRTEEGTNSITENLSPLDFDDPQGYYIVWERCCRNDDINNIVDPGGSGMVFYLEFPPLTVKNSSPVFVLPNGNYICKDQTFTMNTFASDADGDELRYSLVTPMRGNTSRDRPTGAASSKLDYPLVQWVPGISNQNIIPGKPALTLDPDNGRISVVASDLGLYVFTVQCAEYRDGKLIGLVRRDFQLLVIECNQITPPKPVITYNSTITSAIEFCSERPVQLETESATNWAYQWQLDGQNIPGATQSRVTVKDPGSYTVVKSFSNQCSRDTASQSVRLVYGSPPPAVISRAADTLCAGTKLDLLANSGSNYSYEWKKDKLSLTDNKQILTVSETASYHLLVRDEKNGCTARDSAQITVEAISVKLPYRLSVIRGGTLPLYGLVKASALPVRYLWTPNTELVSATDSTPEVSPTDTREYILNVTSPHGCVATDTVLVEVFDRLYMPDAFSPNGDGVNDVLVIQNGPEQIRTMRIFDRWGSVVFYSEKYPSPWDGRFKQSVVPVGSYVYVVETDYHTYKGTLFVLY